MRASERYLVLECDINRNEGCSWMGTALPHFFFWHYTPVLHSPIHIPPNGVHGLTFQWSAWPDLTQDLVRPSNG